MYSGLAEVQGAKMCCGLADVQWPRPGTDFELLYRAIVQNTSYLIREGQSDAGANRHRPASLRRSTGGRGLKSAAQTRSSPALPRPCPRTCPTLPALEWRLRQPYSTVAFFSDLPQIWCGFSSRGGEHHSMGLVC